MNNIFEKIKQHAKKYPEGFYQRFNHGDADEIERLNEKLDYPFEEIARLQKVEEDSIHNEGVMVALKEGYEERGAEIEKLVGRVERLRAELKAHRGYLEEVTNNGTDYNENWDALMAHGLIVKAPPTQDFIDEWGDECDMWVLAWRRE